MANILYYVGLYLIVIIIKLAKLVKEYDSIQLRKNWAKILDVALDLTFAASGCVISLLLNVEKSWIPVVYILSSIILLVASFMEFLSEKLYKVRPWLNGVIIIIIFGGTAILYLKVLKDVDSSGNKIEQDNGKKKYTVIIPYVDESIIGNFGFNKIGNRRFLFKNILEDSTLEAAKIKSIDLFYRDTTLRPLLSSKGLKLRPCKEEILIFRE